MKGLILSGGKGTRLRPITYTGAKQLIPVANKPVLFYGIEAIRDAGIDSIGIVVGDTKEEIKNAVGNGSKWGVKVEYIEQEAPLGLAHAVSVSKDYLGDEPFVMYLGDNLILEGIKNLTEEFKKGQANSQILLVRVQNPEEFGVAELDGDKIVSLVEKPKKPKSDLGLVGVYMFDHNIFKATEELKPSWRGELEITDAIQWLIDHDYIVKPHIIEGWWKDTGKREDLLEANQMILDRLTTAISGDVDKSSTINFKIVVEKGAVVRNSTIRGPAIIGEGAEILDSYIGPFTSIGKDVKVSHSEIEHSIVMDFSRIINITRRIDESIIGKNVVVEELNTRPTVNRLMLGDSSVVNL